MTRPRITITHEFCLCGCGQKLTGRHRNFFSGDCNNKYQTIMRRKNITYCENCGDPIAGHGNTRYCESCKGCERAARKSLPKPELVDSICPMCRGKHRGTTKWEFCKLHKRARLHSDYTAAAGRVCA